MVADSAFDSLATFVKHDGSTASFHSLAVLEEAGICSLAELPFTIRLLLEAALRKCDGFLITAADVERIAAWSPTMTRKEIPFSPSRVLLQDFTGVPARMLAGFCAIPQWQHGCLNCPAH